MRRLPGGGHSLTHPLAPVRPLVHREPQLSSGRRSSSKASSSCTRSNLLPTHTGAVLHCAARLLLLSLVLHRLRWLFAVFMYTRILFYSVSSAMLYISALFNLFKVVLGISCYFLSFHRFTLFFTFMIRVLHVILINGINLVVSGFKRLIDI